MPVIAPNSPRSSGPLSWTEGRQGRTLCRNTRRTRVNGRRSQFGKEGDHSSVKSKHPVEAAEQGARNRVQHVSDRVAD
jgi:hypothetical protein